jgi:YHS domain-containing protein
MHQKLFILGLVTLAMLLTVTATASDQSKASKSAANTLAVCGCGKALMPNEKTEYVSYNGKDYACCTHQCHEMAAKDPASCAKMSEQMTAQKMAQLEHLNLAVANVTAVTEKGTKALCGCGKHFIIDETTEYLQHEGKSYACCTHQCHEMAAKDPAGSVKAVQKQMADMK